MRRLLFIHLSPPDIESGAITDIRNLFRELVQHCKYVDEVILLTNDTKLLDIKVSESKYIKLYFLPVYEIPLYSLRLAIRILVTVFALQKHVNKGIIFIAQEYPTILLPLLFLFRLFGDNVILYKHHSYYYIKFKEVLKYSSRMVGKVYQRVFYIVLNIIFVFFIKIFKPYILVPNQHLANFLKNVYGLPAIYIQPGNYPPYIPIESGNANFKSRICLASSKISLDFITLLELFYKKFSREIHIYGKPYGPQHAYVYSKLKSKHYFKYHGILKRDLLIGDLLKHCKIGIYISYVDTWSYTLYELLLTTRFVYGIVPIKEMLDALIDVYKYMFGNSIRIYSKSLVALFSLVNFDDSRLAILQKKYVYGHCYLFKILYDSYYSRKF
jgi:hypothetical protein